MTNVLHAGTGTYKITGFPATLTVTRADQLPAAMKENKPIVIENAEISQRFSRVEAWREARWWLFGTLVAGLLSMGIARDFKIEASWQSNWKIGKLDGKVVLTPTVRK